MAKPKSKPAPEKKYSKEDVLERFRAKDDPELGNYARYAAAHRIELTKISEKERAKQEKEKQKDAEKKKQFEKAVTPENLYQEANDTTLAEPEDDTDMPSSDIKGKIYRGYQPLGAAPQPGETESAPSPAPPRKPSIKELTATFNHKFAEPKPEKKEKKKQPEKKPARATVKKKIKKAGKRIPVAIRPHATDHPRPITNAQKAPPLPPSKKVDAKYVKEDVRKQEKEKKEEKRGEEKTATEAAKKEAGQHRTAENHKPRITTHFKTGFWIACGILAFLILLLILFIMMVVIIAKFTGVNVFQNGTVVLP